MDEKRRGFTLIELSIVLVIIGLIIGGILVGRDLIAAAHTLKIIKTVQDLDAATQTFKAKYNALPGQVASLADYADPSLVWNNNDGLITMSYSSYGISSHAGGATVSGENLAYFRQLYAAGLSKWGPDAMTPGKDIPYFDNTASTIVLPTTEQCQNYLMPGYQPAPFGDKNYFFLLSIGLNGGCSAFGLGCNLDSVTPSLTTAEAFAIDTKLDDGMPYTGNVRARYGNVPSPYSNQVLFPADAAPGCAGQFVRPPPAASNACVSNAAGNPYLLSATGLQCNLSIGATF